MDKIFKPCDAPKKGPNVTIIDASRSLYGGSGGSGLASSLKDALGTAKDAQTAAQQGSEECEPVGPQGMA